MRVSFANETTARAARNVLEAYGYSTKQCGREIVTDCPTLLAVPAIEKRVGLAAVERVDLSGGDVPGDLSGGDLPGDTVTASAAPQLSA